MALIVGASSHVAVLVLFGLVSGAVSIRFLIRANTVKADMPESGVKLTPAPEPAIRPETIPVAIKTAPSPRASLQRDHRAAIARGLALALVLGVVLTLIFGLADRAAGPAEKIAIGIAFTVFFEVIGGLVAARWLFYLLARVWLALERCLPWSLMNFLADAHQRGVLRQVGAVYQFRHIELQHHLAARPVGRQH